MATGAGRVLVTHGYSDPLVRWLGERGLDAARLETRFTGEEGSAETDASDETAASTQ